MPDLPVHPGDDDTAAPGARNNRAPTRRRPWWKTVAVAVPVVALLALFVVLHVTGVLGPGEH